jgi:hypothetical protein
MNEEGISHANLKQDETDEAIIFVTRNPNILQGNITNKMAKHIERRSRSGREAAVNIFNINEGQYRENQQKCYSAARHAMLTIEDI